MFRLSHNNTILTKGILKTAFDTYYSALVLFAMRFTSEETSKDIVQDVFLKLWKRKVSFENTKSLRAYLYTAVRHQCLNHLKHLKVKNSYADDELKLINNTTYIADLEDQTEKTAELYRAISKLSKRQKEIIICALKGFKNKEISVHLGIKEQTVKTIKSQAYKKLRELLSS